MFGALATLMSPEEICANNPVKYPLCYPGLPAARTGSPAITCKQIRQLNFLVRHEAMFTAICSRLRGQEVITADEAYRKVWQLDDWGAIQSLDGWICPECRQPVFLKGPHERIGKAFSFVVQAHFCHHSAAAAANCALFRAGGAKGQNQADVIYADRRQSLRRFFAEAPETADFLAALLGGEEESLRETLENLL